uniref:Uncharacterized protein n=1 Tax=Capra hircus TaxID=9925 RepID=A0A8C2R3U7_CAPHI
MATQQGTPSSALRVLEEALGMGVSAAGDTAEAVAAEGAYYLEQVTITEASEDDYEYEEIPDDNYSIPEGEEDLAKAVQMVQEQATDTQILLFLLVERKMHQKVLLKKVFVKPENKANVKQRQKLIQRIQNFLHICNQIQTWI